MSKDKKVRQISEADVPQDFRTIMDDHVSHYTVNWDNMTTVDDVKALLKGMKLKIAMVKDKIPEDMQELFDRDLLKLDEDGE